MYKEDTQKSQLINDLKQFTQSKELSKKKYKLNSSSSTPMSSFHESSSNDLTSSSSSENNSLSSSYKEIPIIIEDAQKRRSQSLCYQKRSKEIFFKYLFNVI